MKNYPVQINLNNKTRFGYIHRLNSKTVVVKIDNKYIKVKKRQVPSANQA